MIGLILLTIKQVYLALPEIYATDILNLELMHIRHRRN